MPEGICFPQFFCPWEACQDEDSRQSGRVSCPRGRKHLHFRLEMECMVKGRVTRRARNEDSRGCRGTERGMGVGQEEAFHLGCLLSSVQIFLQ